MKLQNLSDKQLLQDTKKLAGDEREISLQVLKHLREIERRRLFSDLGYGSLFDYAVNELGYSEPSANRRIQASRLLNEIPAIEKKIVEGSLTLTNLAMAGNLFKNERINNPELKLEILKKIEDQSSRECSKTLLGFQSAPLIPKETQTQTTVTITTMKFNFTNETVTLLDEIKNLVAHSRLSNDELFKRIFKNTLEDLKTKKYKLNAKFTTAPASPCETRYVSAIVKKEVYLRDKGRCTKCQSTYKIEYDHIKPFAIGGDSSAKNLRLLCFSCNQRRLK